MRLIRGQTSSKFLSGLSLQRRIIIGSTTAVIVPFLIMAIFLYQRLSRELTDQSREKSVQIAKDLSALIDTSLKMELKVISAIAADNQIADALHERNYEAIHAKLTLVFNRIGSNYISIYITDRSGIVRVDLPESARKGFDVSDKEGFVRAIQGIAGVTGPVLSRGPASSRWTNVPILVTTAPVTRNGIFVGAIAITHDIDSIRSIMSGIRIGKTGYPFITDGNGLVIIHPNHDYEMKVNMFKETGMETIREKIRHREIGAERYNFRGTEKIAGFAPLNITGWNIIFTQNRKEIMEPVNDTLLSIAIIGISFIIIVILSIILLSKKISSPIQKFVDILQKFATHTNEFILGIGSDKRIMFANPAAEQFTGKSAEELIGSDPDFTNTQNIPPEVIWEKIGSGATWLGRITPKTEIDNGPVIAIMIIPVKDEKGNISGYLEFGRDISGELIQEKRIQQAQKIEAIGTLAGGIAHDFNNILTGMYGYIELALLTPENPAKTEQYLGELQKAATRASDLVNQILTFSRHSKPELQSIRPQTIVKEVIKLIRASTPAEIIIEANLESETAIMADPIQIHQVIVNLCTNAIHAIDEKHGTIKIDLEDIIIDQKFTESHPGLGTGKHVLFRISDTGKGILPDVIDHIFEPFFTTKENGGGTGLGLSVVHGIIHNLGGIITVYSEPGKGSVFNIFIPAALHDADNATSDRSGLMHGTEHIMLIDDESAIVSPVSSILASIGYQVSPFTESMLALETLRKNPDAFDIVITDHSMPEFTGIDIAIELKQLKRSLPVILMSGFVNRQMEEHAAKCGIDAIVKKPVSMSVLTGIIRKILDKQD